jgi:hypothetical protein
MIAALEVCISRRSTPAQLRAGVTQSSRVNRRRRHICFEVKELRWRTLSVFVNRHFEGCRLAWVTGRRFFLPVTHLRQLMIEELQRVPVRLESPAVIALFFQP